MKKFLEYALITFVFGVLAGMTIALFFKYVYVEPMLAHNAMYIASGGSAATIIARWDKADFATYIGTSVVLMLITYIGISVVMNLTTYVGMRIGYCWII